MKKAPRLQRLALCTGMQNRVSGRKSEEEWVKCWSLDWQQGWCWCVTLKLCPESSNCWRSRASECYSDSLCCFRTELLTHKSIFTCKITLSCSSSKTWWKSVLLLETYLHLSCYFLTPQLILSCDFLCNNPLPISMALFTFFKSSQPCYSSVYHYQVTKFILIPHYLSKRWCWGALQILQTSTIRLLGCGIHRERLGSLWIGTATPHNADSKNNNNNNKCLSSFLMALCRQNNRRSYFWIASANMFVLLCSPLRRRWIMIKDGAGRFLPLSRFPFHHL